MERIKGKNLGPSSILHLSSCSRMLVFINLWQPEVENQVNMSNSQRDTLERRLPVSVSLGMKIVVSAKSHWIFSFVIRWVLKRETVFFGEAGLHCFYITTKILRSVNPRNDACISPAAHSANSPKTALRRKSEKCSDTECFTTQNGLRKNS